MAVEVAQSASGPVPESPGDRKEAAEAEQEGDGPGAPKSFSTLPGFYIEDRFIRAAQNGKVDEVKVRQRSMAPLFGAALGPGLWLTGQAASHVMGLVHVGGCRRCWSWTRPSSSSRVSATPACTRRWSGPRCGTSGR